MFLARKYRGLWHFFAFLEFFKKAVLGWSVRKPRYLAGQITIYLLVCICIIVFLFIFFVDVFIFDVFVLDFDVFC